MCVESVKAATEEDIKKAFYLGIDVDVYLRRMEKLMIQVKTVNLTMDRKTKKGS